MILQQCLPFDWTGGGICKWLPYHTSTCCNIHLLYMMYITGAKRGRDYSPFTQAEKAQSRASQACMPVGRSEGMRTRSFNWQMGLMSLRLSSSLSSMQSCRVFMQPDKEIHTSSSAAWHSQLVPAGICLGLLVCVRSCRMSQSSTAACAAGRLTDHFHKISSTENWLALGCCLHQRGRCTASLAAVYALQGLCVKYPGSAGAGGHAGAGE